jgi:hypothetical protein
MSSLNIRARNQLGERDGGEGGGVTSLCPKPFQDEIILKCLTVDTFEARPVTSTGCRPSPLSSTCRDGRLKSFERGNYPLLPTGIGGRCSQTISNLGHAALLCRCEIPLKTKVLN